jgi:hypothetical protein
MAWPLPGRDIFQGFPSVQKSCCHHIHNVVTFSGPIPPTKDLSTDNPKLKHIFGKLKLVGEKSHDIFADTNCVGDANPC